MTTFKRISEDLVNNLQLQFDPVGVKIYTESDPLPENIAFTEKELKSYCQAVILAGEGETLLLEKENMGCKLGTSVLVFEKEMEAYSISKMITAKGIDPNVPEVVKPFQYNNLEPLSSQQSLF